LASIATISVSRASVTASAAKGAGIGDGYSVESAAVAESGAPASVATVSIASDRIPIDAFSGAGSVLDPRSAAALADIVIKFSDDDGGAVSAGGFGFDSVGDWVSVRLNCARLGESLQNRQTADFSPGHLSLPSKARALSQRLRSIISLREVI
jgi:hypothetical protein